MELGPSYSASTSRPLTAYDKGYEKRTELRKTPLVKTDLRDKVEISSRAYGDRLEMIRQRVQGGFYSKAEVADDISDKLSKLLSSMDDKLP